MCIFGATKIDGQIDDNNNTKGRNKKVKVNVNGPFDQTL